VAGTTTLDQLRPATSDNPARLKAGGVFLCSEENAMTQEFAIRSATASDVAAIRDVTRAAYAKWIPIIGREPLPMNADYEQAVAKHQFDLLFIAGEMAALIETELRGDHLWIENIAVRPEHQGKGLGRHLMAVVEARALAAGFGEARLLTNQAFEANVALYQRIGYVIERLEPFTNGSMTVYMSKRLKR
jgi:GNAT superfamily N-acetyltransferase